MLRTIGKIAWSAIGFIFPALIVGLAIGVAVDIGDLFRDEFTWPAGIFSWGLVWASIMYWRWSLNRTEGYIRHDDKTIDFVSRAPFITSINADIGWRTKENDNE